ncbi:MAG: hypothetical protein ACR2H0_00450 [Candidatus Limnocylindrales bacterium]
MKTAPREPRPGARSRGRLASATARLSERGTVSVRLRRAAYPILTIASVGIVAAGQLVEDLGDSPPLQMLPPALVIQRWTVIALVLYALVMWVLLDVTARRSLTAVRNLVKIDQGAFDSYVQRMRHPAPIVDGVIFLGCALITVVLFVGLRADLLIDDPVTELATKLPADPIAAAVILLGHTVIGWAFLRLIYVAARLARQLGRLSREPLSIDVFDTSDLVPFGNIALALALAPAGVILILLVELGVPTTVVGWSVVVEATLAIVLALLLPLRGIHSQMAAAKDAALARLSSRIGELYETVSGSLPTEASEATRVGATTSALIPLRKTVQEMTTWPFRDTVALGRAVLIASAPLIYATLSEVIRVFIIGPNAPPPPGT